MEVHKDALNEINQNLPPFSKFNEEEVKLYVRRAATKESLKSVWHKGPEPGYIILIKNHYMHKWEYKGYERTVPEPFIQLVKEFLVKQNHDQPI